MYWNASCGESCAPASRAGGLHGIQIAPPDMPGVPPYRLLFSITTTCSPPSAAAAAAVWPPAPEPTTSTSVETSQFPPLASEPIILPLVSISPSAAFAAGGPLAESCGMGAAAGLPQTE